MYVTRSHRRRRKKMLRRLSFVFTSFCLLTSVLVVLKLLPAKANTVPTVDQSLAVQAAQTGQDTTTSVPTPPDKITGTAALSLKEQINAITANTTGTFGIAIKNLTTGETYYEYADEDFFMASTYKPPLVLQALKDIEKGTLSSQDKLGYFPILDGIRLIITRSEEDLAQLLADEVGWPRVQNLATSMGMKKTDFIDEFTTTPRDQLVFMEAIYKGTNMTPNVRDQLYNLLAQQQINDRLPKYLPKDVIVAHKTGEYELNRHDVGIVTVGKQTYIIALMSKDLGVPEDGKEALAEISYVVYRYFTQKT